MYRIQLKDGELIQAKNIQIIGSKWVIEHPKIRFCKRILLLKEIQTLWLPEDD